MESGNSVRESQANGFSSADRRIALVLDAEGREDRLDTAAEGGRFLGQLARRKVAQWMLAYLAMAWVLLQLTDILSGIWSWSVRLQQIISLVLGLGALPASVVSWYHGEKGRQAPCRIELVLLVTLVAASSAIILSVLGAQTAG